MSVLGINVENKSLRFTVLGGSKKSPVFVEKDRHVINAATSIAELMGWYESTFNNLIDRVSPSAIGCKLSLEGKKAQIPYWYYPYGILNLIAHQRTIPVEEFIPRNFTPSKFGLDKSVDIYSHIDDVIGVHRPHWDRGHKYSVLAAWMVLK
jgi:hypothetical protein